MSLESDVQDHYGRGDLLAAIEDGLGAMDKSSSAVYVEDLAAVDEFHIGGRAATTLLCDRLSLSAESSVLDVGCGIGGAARFLASTVQCRVVGLDLTPPYMAAARALTEWTDLGHLVSFALGSAVQMPFQEASFDGATQFHVGMNIPDKEALFSEVFRTLRPGGSFGVYDIVVTSPGEISFPVPWATHQSMSAVDDVATYEQALETAGFQISHVEDRSDFALEFFAAQRDRSESLGSPAPLGLHLLTGSDASTKMGNMVAAIGAGILAPTEIIARKPAEGEV